MASIMHTDIVKRARMWRCTGNSDLELIYVIIKWLKWYSILFEHNFNKVLSSFAIYLFKSILGSWTHYETFVGINVIAPSFLQIQNQSADWFQHDLNCKIEFTLSFT